MDTATRSALADLRETARNHPGASGGEKRAWRLLRSLTAGEPCSLIDDFVGLDATRQAAVISVLAGLASGSVGQNDLRDEAS